MNVLFVNYSDFTSNSAVHIFNIANELVKCGIQCTVFVPSNKNSVSILGTHKFRCFDFEDFNVCGKCLFENDIPTIVHAWTPREIVRRFTDLLCESIGIPYLVHLEDNEEEIFRSTFRISPRIAKMIPNFLLNKISRPQYIYPGRYEEFLNNSSGITTIIDKLLELKPKHVPGLTIWPGFEQDLFYPMPPDIKFKRSIGIDDNGYNIVYSGNVHRANRKEVRNLYRAIAFLHQKGHSIRLIRTGRNFCRFLDRNLMKRSDIFLELGFVDRRQLPSVLSLADAFVQPGVPGAFNDYRFPSKLSEFFAMGKPVILPNTNVACSMIDHENCVFLDQGDYLDIACKIESLMLNKEYAKDIGQLGCKFAFENFNWRKSSFELYQFYLSVTSGGSGN